MFYDPMIAKLVTYGSTRDQAIEHMRTALDEFLIRGVSHNMSFLSALMMHPRFVEGRISTNMIAEEYPDGFHPADVPHDDPALLVAVAATVHRRYMDLYASISGQLKGLERKVHDEWVVVMGGEEFPVVIKPVEDRCLVTHDGETYEVVSDWHFGQPLFRGSINGQLICMQVERDNITYRLLHRGSQAEAKVLTSLTAELNRHMIEKEPPDMSRFLLSPMPGLLVRVSVEEGDDVKAGEELAVVEAMKMENVLRATRDGVVKAVMAEAGASLAVDQAIIEFE